MIGRQRDLIRVVETAYQIDLDSSQWLEQLAEVFSAMHGAEHGLMVYLYDASKPDEGADIHDYALCDLSDDFAKGAVLHNAKSPAQDVRRVYHSGVICGTVSEILAPQKILPKDHPSFSLHRQFNPGCEDAWGLSASNPDGRGVGLAAPLAEVSKMSEAMRELWGLVGVHLATAYRLRRARAETQDGIGGDGDTAVLEPDGTLVDADGVGLDKSARESLRHATRQIDRARSNKLRHEPSEALPIWKGLVEGRWTLVERHDTDGRRFVVAHPNDPRIDEPQILTKHERLVAAYASQGDSDARISYSLGLDQETVGELIASAMRKLGVESRDALIWLRQLFS